MKTLQIVFSPSKDDSLARAFSRVGWIGFWIQIAIGAIPLALLIYSFVFGGGAGAGTRGGFRLIEFLTVISLVILAFTTIWFFRYTRLGRHIADPAQRPSEAAVQKAVWTGVAASTLGIAFSVIITLFEVTQLLIYFLRAPQAGIPVVQTTGGGTASWISAADIVSLMVLNLSLLAEVAVLALGVWLLLRTTIASVEFPHVGE
jgi:hypothetical protein